MTQKIRIYKSPKTATHAEERARAQGKPFPKVVLIQSEWRWDYDKYKKLYEGLIRESERLSCFLQGDFEGFMNPQVVTSVAAEEAEWIEKNQ